jgi:hypothetical protein
MAAARTAHRLGEDGEDMLNSQLWKARDALANKNGLRKTVFFVAPDARKDVDPRRISAAGPSGPIESFKTTGSYQGEWRDNQKEGFGTQTFSDGSKVRCAT